MAALLNQLGIAVSAFGTVLIALDLLETERLAKLERSCRRLLVEYSKPLHLLESAGKNSIIGAGFAALMVYISGIFIVVAFSILVGLELAFGLDITVVGDWFYPIYEVIICNPVSDKILHHQIKFENRWLSIVLGVTLTKGAFAIASTFDQKEKASGGWIFFMALGFVAMYFFLGLWVIWIIAGVVVALIALILLFPSILIFITFFLFVTWVGSYLKSRIGFKNALPAAGVLLMLFGFFLQWLTVS